MANSASESDENLDEVIGQNSLATSSSLLTQKQNQPNNTDNKYNISNVLKHIYSMKYVQKSNQSNNNANNAGAISTDNNLPTSRQFWMPDDQVKECYECNDKFTTFRRRHVISIFTLNYQHLIQC